MISISGIKYQEELEQMPYFNKKEAAALIGKQGRNLDKKITQLKKIGYLKTIRKGIYVSSAYADKESGESYMQFIANILRSPSYISTEYVMAREGLIPESVYWVTSVTVKSSRKYSNFLGNFLYRSIKKPLFLGIEEKVGIIILFIWPLRQRQYLTIFISKAHIILERIYMTRESIGIIFLKMIYWSLKNM